MNKPEVRAAGKFSAPQAEGVKKISREDLAKQIKKMRDRDAELVTGIFKNLENPASSGGRGSLVLVTRCIMATTTLSMNFLMESVTDYLVV